MSNSDAFISLNNVSRTYFQGNNCISVLKSISLRIHKGDSCSIVGASGSGKSTLLNILGLLDQPSSGSYLLDKQPIAGLSKDQTAMIRNRQIGFVFQSFNLLPRLNAIDNVALPLLYRGIGREEARRHAMQQLAKVGLSDRTLYFPADLSGGQRQRVAIARALVGTPALILADEPTGNLDAESAQSVLSLLLELNQKDAVTLVLVTHDAAVSRQLGRQIVVRDGEIVEDDPATAMGAENA